MQLQCSTPKLLAAERVKTKDLQAFGQHPIGVLFYCRVNIAGGNRRCLWGPFLLRKRIGMSAKDRASREPSDETAPRL